MTKSELLKLLITTISAQVCKRDQYCTGHIFVIVGLIFDLSLELRGLASAVNNNNYVTSAVLVTFDKPGQKSSTLVPARLLGSARLFDWGPKLIELASFLQFFISVVTW